MKSKGDSYNGDFIDIQPYTALELSSFYGVTKNTFLRWLRKFSDELGAKDGWYYSKRQVEIIFEKLGHPEKKN